MKKIFLIFVLLVNTLSITTAQTFGSFTDARDGKLYKTVKIGSQTWMVENLAYKANNGCWAYQNKLSNVSIHGYLYTWSAAKNSCPSGWHLPSYTEWTILIDKLGGKEVAGGKLKSKSNWIKPNAGASNSSGFTAFASGYGLSGYNDDFMGKFGVWWSSTTVDLDNSYQLQLLYDLESAWLTKSSKTAGKSCRCIKD